jgi:DNA-binding FadR family transcriptional regulator
MGRRLLREPEILSRLGVGRTTLNEEFIKTKRLKWVRPARRVKAIPEDEVDALVDELIAERDIETAAA